MKKRYYRLFSGLLAVFLIVVELLADCHISYAAESASDALTDADLIDDIDFETICYIRSAYGLYNYSDDEVVTFIRSFDEYPDTLITSSDGASSYSIAATAIGGSVLVAILAGCGIYVAVNEALDIFAQYEKTVRADSSKNTLLVVLSSILTCTESMKIPGISGLIIDFREWLTANFTGYGTAEQVSYSYYSGSGLLLDGPYSPHTQAALQGDYSDYRYICSVLVNSGQNKYADIAIPNSAIRFCFVNSTQGSNNSIYIFTYDGLNILRSDKKTSLSIYKYFHIEDGVYNFGTNDLMSKEISFGGTTSTLAKVINTYPYPIFKYRNSTDLENIENYLTTGLIGNASLIKPSNDLTITPNVSWPTLQQTAYDFGDSITAPASEEAAQALIDNLSTAQTADDVSSLLGSSLASTAVISYENLAYIIERLAGGLGVTLTTEQIDAFINSFYAASVQGSAAVVEDQADEILKKFVVINGGKAPNDNKDDNEYRVLKPFGVSLAAFLAEEGLISDSGAFDDISAVENVELVPYLNPDVSTDPSWISSITKPLNGIWESVRALPEAIAHAISDIVIGEDDGMNQVSSIITQKFPFCIPFDIVHCFKVFQSEAVAPVWKIPFSVHNDLINIDYDIVIDLSDWERPVEVLRFCILISFIFMLVYSTRYLIKG